MEGSALTTPPIWAIYWPGGPNGHSLWKQNVKKEIGKENMTINKR
jgi:hypothetical protein